MTIGNPLKLIFNFSLPLLLGSLLQQTYSLIDAAIVGRFLGVNALASVGASSSVIFLILGFCNGNAAGFGIPVAQSFGAKDYSSMRSYVANSYRLAVGISVLFALVCSILCDDILQLMQTPKEIFTNAYIYLLITFLGIPCTLFYNLLASIIRALGDSKTPFYFLLFSSILNILLDLVFILIFHLGTGGAALATIIAQGVSAFTCYLYMKKNYPILTIQGDEGDVNLSSMRTLLLMGMPMGLQFSITAIGSIMLQSSNNALGPACVAAFTTAMRIKMFFMSPLDTLGIAMATYCGQNLGAKKIDRIWHGIKDALGMVIIYWIVCAVFMWFVGRDLSSIFVGSDENEILDFSRLFLRISCCNYFFLGVLSILRNSLQGVGFTKLAINSGVFEMIARVCVSLFLVPVAGFLGVCWGDAVAWMAACTFLTPAITVVYRKLKSRYSPT